MTKADDTGRYIVGRVLGAAENLPVLWSNGVPRLLTDAPGDEPAVIDVNSSGTVLGSSTAKDGTTLPWLFSNGKYQLLEVPDYLNGTGIGSAINNRGDVVGSGWSVFTEGFAAVVWPAGGKARVLLAPEDREAGTTDINDDGVVIGSSTITRDGRERQIGLRWAAWDQVGEYVYAPDKHIGMAYEIRGHYSGGADFQDNGVFTGGVWDDRNETFHALPGIPASINGSGDAVSIDELDGRWGMVTANGVLRWRFPAQSRIATLMDRHTGPGTDAAGTNAGQAVVWHNCSDAITD